MEITAKELALDAAADKAAKELADFRNKHRVYFWNVGHKDHLGQPTVPENHQLNREATRLHTVVREANKRAADAEYYAKHPAR